MNLLEQQADSYLPNSWLRPIGALRTYAARMQFFLGVPNTLMIAVLFYRDSTLIQAYVPTVWHWVGIILFVIVPAAVLVDRVLLHPAQIIYDQFQNGHENRSPNYRETMETKRKVGNVEQKLDQLLARTDGGQGQATVVPVCQECESKGVPDEHKGIDVISCPECDSILVRGVVG
ncbi:hypothetical protein [Natrinema sp. DC36]|uniref:hypothetical protein n=1 Tax=Natrinema sp. DC36 TaxID=2878680 RepID=UPI001CF06498|nr:hypothetical protein [Natrinema sp. DC36]